MSNGRWIDDVAQEAWTYACENTPVDGSVGMGVVYDRKFAELVVKKCAAECKNMPMRICGYTDDKENPYYKGYQLGYYDGYVDSAIAIENLLC